MKIALLALAFMFVPQQQEKPVTPLLQMHGTQDNSWVAPSCAANAVNPQTNTSIASCTLGCPTGYELESVTNKCWPMVVAKHRVDPVFTDDLLAKSRAACESVVQLAAETQKLHPDLSISSMCGLSESNRDDLKVPVRHISLASTELRHLRSLQALSDAAYEAQNAYEKLLMKRHGVRNVDVGDPCYHFADIVYQTDYITDDPNPMMPGCVPAAPGKDGR